MVSYGELHVIPEYIYLQREKLKRRLKRSPTDEEFARFLGTTVPEVKDMKSVKVKYTENTLPLKGVRYKHAKPLKRTNLNTSRFKNNTQYNSDNDSISGGARRKIQRKTLRLRRVSRSRKHKMY